MTKHPTYREVEGVTERRCSTCGQWVPYDVEHFNRNRYRGRELQGSCKPCSREHSRAWRREQYHSRRAA